MAVTCQVSATRFEGGLCTVLQVRVTQGGDRKFPSATSNSAAARHGAACRTRPPFMGYVARSRTRVIYALGSASSFRVSVERHGSGNPAQDNPKGCCEQALQLLAADDFLQSLLLQLRSHVAWN